MPNKMPDREALAATVTELTTMQDTADVNKWLGALHDAVDMGVEFTLDGEAAFLNPMMQLRRASLAKYATVLKMIDDKRTESGLGKLAEKAERRTYMAGHMVVKRGRERKLADMWNEMLDPSRRLVGPARQKFMALHAKRWNDEKKLREKQLRDKLGRSLTKEEQRVIINQVEDEIDLELQELEKFMREEVRKPVHQKNPAGFKFRVGQWKQTP